MSERSAARAIQRLSGWPYQKCLQWFRKHHAEVRDGPESYAVRAAMLWQELEAKATEPHGLATQEVVLPKAADEDHCVICGGTGFDLNQSEQLVPCDCRFKNEEKLPRLQYNLLRDLVTSPRGGEYVKPNYRPALSLQERGFIETVVRPQSGDRPGDWWRATEAGKRYFERLQGGHERPMAGD